MLCVLVLASGAGWESDALGALGDDAGLVVLKRCVDVDDLLATAATGQAEVAVVAWDAPGLDHAAVTQLRGHGVRTVIVVDDPGREDRAARLARLDLAAVVGVASLDSLPATVRDAASDPGTRMRPTLPVPGGPLGSPPGLDGLPVEPLTRPVIAVWGPGGAPGRTTLATAFATELARRDPAPVLLVDADPYGGTVAQHLGILDEVSGLLSAGRLRPAELPARLPALCRAVGSHGLGVLTGLPRPDRWTELTAGVLGHTLDAAREMATVVVDTGFGLQGGAGDPAAAWQGPGRDALTVEALEAADELLVVGAADPVGLSRLARGLVDLRDVVGDRPVRVVVNRMRPSLGWSRSEVAAMVEGFATLSGVHFLPDDPVAVDRALVAGRGLGETRDSALARAVAQVVDAVLPHTCGGQAGLRRRRITRRTAGTARRR